MHSNIQLKINSEMITLFSSSRKKPSTLQQRPLKHFGCFPKQLINTPPRTTSVKQPRYCQAGIAACPSRSWAGGREGSAQRPSALGSARRTAPGNPAQMATARQVSLLYYGNSPWHSKLRDDALGSLERVDLLWYLNAKTKALQCYTYYSDRKSILR